MRENYLRKILEKLDPAWALRLGLGLMFIYSGFNLFYYPQNWYGFLPPWLIESIAWFIPVDFYLRVQGVGEFIVGLLFLSWFSGKWGLRTAAVLATLEMAMILLFVGIDLITFRDIGLLGAAFAILIISCKEAESALRPPIQ